MPKVTITGKYQMPKVTITGKYQNKSDAPEELNVVLLQGIGDIIYTWYKLSSLVKSGVLINAYVSREEPKRSHQLVGLLPGLKSLKYIDGINYMNYWLKNINDLRNPPLDCQLGGKPVLHINSFIESDRDMNEFLPCYPMDYNINFTTSEENKTAANNIVDPNYFNILVYTSNYVNNCNCRMHPDPTFWASLPPMIHELTQTDKKLRVIVAGAEYDKDLSIATNTFLKMNKIDSMLLINQNLGDIMEIIRAVDYVVTYESGFMIMSDALNTNCIAIYRYQGPPRNDKNIPYLGAINPVNIDKTYFPMFYDDSLASIKEKMTQHLQGGKSA